MKNYKEIQKFKEEAARLTEDMCNASVNNIDAAFNIGYRQGYIDGKEAQQQECATALHDIENTYIKGQKAEYDRGFKEGKEAAEEDMSKYYNKHFNDVVHSSNDDAYQRGYEDGMQSPSSMEYRHGYEAGLQHGQELRVAEADCAYKKGLNAAWETAKKILLNESYGGYTYEEVTGIFGKARLDVIKEHSIQEVISKIEASKNKHKRVTENCDNCEHSESDCSKLGICSVVHSLLEPKDEQKQSEKPSETISNDAKVGDIIKTLKNKNSYGLEVAPIGSIGIIAAFEDELDLAPYRIRIGNCYHNYSSDMFEIINDEYNCKDNGHDCISREAVLIALTGDTTDCTIEDYIQKVIKRVNDLTPVKM